MLFYETKIFSRMLDKFKLGKMNTDKFIKDMKDFQRFYDSLVLDYYKDKSEHKVEINDYLDELQTDIEIDNDFCKKCDRRDSRCVCVIR
jgi:hypothetical protein